MYSPYGTKNAQIEICSCYIVPNGTLCFNQTHRTTKPHITIRENSWKIFFEAQKDNLNCDSLNCEKSFKSP